jgi:hypothetical protein
VKITIDLIHGLFCWRVVTYMVNIASSSRVVYSIVSLVAVTRRDALTRS